jgi:hypothetical protein
MTYTDVDVIEAVASSRSLAQALTKLGLAPKGGNYRTLKRHIKRLNLDTGHILGKGWSVGTGGLRPRIPDNEVFVAGRRFDGQSLRKRLVANGLEEKCSSCGGTAWMGHPMPLEIDHIDGVNDNNVKENLRLLCPNCHALTPTYRGKNIQSAKERRELVRQRRQKKKEAAKQKSRNICPQNTCVMCKTAISKKGVRCKSCATKFRARTKIDWPPTEDLKGMVESASFSAVGRSLGVSDNAIRKRLKNHP